MSAISMNSRLSILQDNVAGNNAMVLYDVLPCPARGALISCLVSGAVDAWLSPVVKGAKHWDVQ